MYSAYKLNKQADNIQHWCIPFSILNQSIVPCSVLTVASWTASRFLRRQVRWSGIPISLRIFHGSYVVCVCLLSCFSCVWLCDPVDCGLPGSSVHGILQVRVLEWAAMPSSRGSSQPRDRTYVSPALAGGFFTTEPCRCYVLGTWESRKRRDFLWRDVENRKGQPHCIDVKAFSFCFRNQVHFLQ